MKNFNILFELNIDRMTGAVLNHVCGEVNSIDYDPFMKYLRKMTKEEIDKAIYDYHKAHGLVHTWLDHKDHVLWNELQNHLRGMGYE